MSYPWTPQQEDLYKAILDPTNTLIKVGAVAGASKTSSMVEAARRVKALHPSKTIRYLVFGSLNSQEAKLAFAHNAICSTLHSLAYHAVIKPYGLKTPIKAFIGWRDIPKTLNIPYHSVQAATDIVYEYCDSPSLEFETFALTTDYKATDLAYAKSLLAAMYAGELNTTHSFYLKLYHLGIMSGDIVPVTEDILIIDEASDLTQITLDIFDRYPARQKIIVGDRAQMIFGFMGCVSAFDAYKGQGISLPLTKSFRCTTQLAERIQDFCNSTFSPSMVFEGMDYPSDIVPVTEVYLARTNADLITKMIELNNSSTPYNLSTKSKVKQMFKYPMFLVGAKPGAKQFDADLKTLQRDLDTWELIRIKDPSFTMSKTAYLVSHNKDNPAVASASALLARFGPKDLIDAYHSAEEHKHSSSNLTLCTIHVSKGGTWDIVTLDNSVDKAIEETMKMFKLKPNYIPDEDEITSLRLHYVACSRARFKINNSRYL